jgi:histidine ammonia-lyase/tyrosine ammonia-lyase
VAGVLADILTGSNLTAEHSDLMTAVKDRRGEDGSVRSTGVYIQHAYSLRCVPQILGPVLDTFDFCRRVVETELNSCNDNPLVFETAEESFHGGNFHGQYVAMACDYLAIALTEIGVLAERQLNRIVDPHLNGNLPEFLALRDGGLACGLMGAQYLATSIASENLDLAAPSSVKSIPTNGSNQDVVSMGLNAARRCLWLCDNVSRIVGVLGAACYQAASIIGPEAFSPASREWYEVLARHTEPYDGQEPVSNFLESVRHQLLDGDVSRVIRHRMDLQPAHGPELVPDS